MNPSGYQDDSEHRAPQPGKPTAGQSEEYDELAAMAAPIGEEETSGFVLGYN